MKNYNKRKWLNKSGSMSTGSVVAFHGKVSWGEDKQKQTMTVLEVADCHGKVRLHQRPEDSTKDFIKKMRKLAKVATKFADYLEK